MDKSQQVFSTRFRMFTCTVPSNMDTLELFIGELFVTLIISRHHEVSSSRYERRIVSLSLPKLFKPSRSLKTIGNPKTRDQKCETRRNLLTTSVCAYRICVKCLSGLCLDLVRLDNGFRVDHLHLLSSTSTKNKAMRKHGAQKRASAFRILWNGGGS